MIKVSITLPNNTQITLESEEPWIIHEIVGIVLRDWPRELMLSTSITGEGPHPTPSGDHGGTSPQAPPVATPSYDRPENGTSSEQSSGASPVPTPQFQAGETAAQVVRAEGHRDGERASPSAEPASEPKAATEAEAKFIQFCQSANPMGDMRRVVVAAHGASKFLNQPSVDTQELSRLFQLIGWHPPHSLVQTLRNAARSKFRWMERIPGRSGHYSATDVGRAITFGS